MKIFNLQNVPHEHVDDPEFATEMQTRRLGDVAGSEKLYVNIDYVKPGAASTKYHDHDRQEEFFLILSGSGILRTNDGEFPVKVGDFVAKPAGRGIAHQFINTGTDMMQILDCGNRVPDDVITYPDEDVVYLRKHGLAFKKSDRLTDWSS